MTSPMSVDELRMLIEAMRTGEAAPEQHRRLEEMLRRDADFRRYYVHYLWLCADLQSILPSQDAGELVAVLTAQGQSKPQVFPGKQSGVAQQSMGGEAEVCKGAVASCPVQSTSADASWWRFRGRSLWSTGTVVAVTLVLALGIPSVWRLGRNRPLPVARQDATVATLVAAIGAQWEGDTPLSIGSPLSAIPLRLNRGLAEIRFRSGAAVILQGPVACVLESPSHLSLQRRRISAKASKEAIGFTVRTDQATVVDLGTEFGVSSEGSGKTDVHVFRGQVALGTSFGFKPDRQLLSEGFAKRVDADGSRIDDIRSDELAFVGPREFEARVKALHNSPYHRWLAGSYRLRREPALVLYYAWDGPVDDLQHVINGAEATGGRLDGLLGNGQDSDTRPQWISPGRWPEQRALRFDSSRQQHLRVPHTNELNITQALTIAAWIRPNTALMPPTGVIASKRMALSHNAQPNYELALVCEHNERGEVECALSFRSGSREVTSVGMPVVPGEWMHVAISANGEESVLYMDGQRVALGGRADFVPSEGDLWIGTAPAEPQGASANENESFEGLISEFVLVRRSMPEKEIQEMWSIGMPEL